MASSDSGIIVSITDKMEGGGVGWALCYVCTFPIIDLLGAVFVVFRNMEFNGINWSPLDKPADEQSDVGSVAVEPILIAPIANLVKQEDEATLNNEDNHYGCGYDLKSSPGNSSFSFPWNDTVVSPFTSAYGKVVSE